MMRIIVFSACFALTGCADMDNAKQAVKAGDYQTARRHYKELAEFGLPEAKTEYALLLLKKGDGFTPDPKSARILLEESVAEMQHPRAFFELGKIYQDGNGIPRDLAKSTKYYSAALKLDYLRARHQIGRIYEEQGRYAEAEALYKESIKENNFKAAQSLGDLYKNGKAYPKDPVLRLAWYYYARDKGITGLENSINNGVAKAKGLDFLQLIDIDLKNASAQKNMLGSDLAEFEGELEAMVVKGPVSLEVSTKRKSFQDIKTNLQN
jgi:TPR repeat protein